MPRLFAVVVLVATGLAGAPAAHAATANASEAVIVEASSVDAANACSRGRGRNC
jgi:hypothetical protein